jgi:hypothetical protein
VRRWQADNGLKPGPANPTRAPNGRNGKCKAAGRTRISAPTLVTLFDRFRCSIAATPATGSSLARGRSVGDSALRRRPLDSSGTDQARDREFPFRAAGGGGGSAGSRQSGRVPRDGHRQRRSPRHAGWRRAAPMSLLPRGCEAGGHRGMFLAANLEEEAASQPSTLALVPQIADPVGAPKIKALSFGLIDQYRSDCYPQSRR